MNRIEKQLLEQNDTAFYVFDVRELMKRTAFLRAHLPEDAALCYAVKANPFLIDELADVVERLEICSPGEARICGTLDVPTEKMVISGVYKTPAVIESMVRDAAFQGIFTVESMTQYRMLSVFAAQYGRTLPVLLRLTNKSQFGMDEAQIEQIVAERDGCPQLRLLGVQFFSGTQRTSIKKIRRELEMLDQFLTHLRDAYRFESEELEYGTGFPVSYFEGETFDELSHLRDFSETLSGMQNKPRVILEIGRSLVASCGKYYTHIVDIKHNGGQNYLLTDGGMHHLVYFGQYMAMKQPMLSVVGKQTVDPDVAWNICGALCSMNDILAKQVRLPEVEIGDTLVFDNAGAYSMTEGISLFLTRELPAVWLLQENGEPLLIRKPFETEPLNTPNYDL